MTSVLTKRGNLDIDACTEGECHVSVKAEVRGCI